MAKEYAKAFYGSMKWKNARKAFIKKREAIDGGVCQHCKRRRGYIVDHINPITPENINDINITLNEENFQFLCLPCHNIKTFNITDGVPEGFEFDEWGNLV